jgi:transposase
MWSQLIKVRMLKVNQSSVLFYKFCADFPQCRQRGLKEVPDALVHLENSISPMMLDTIRQQLKRLEEMDKDIAEIEKRLTLWKKDQEAVTRLMAIPCVELLAGGNPRQTGRF